MTRIGAQRPRFMHLPPGRVSSAGQEAIDLAAACGLVLDDWQRWVVDQAAAENSAGQWCATQVGLIVPRQCGKGSILEAIELAALFLWGEKLVVHSAHKFDTSQEHFLRMETLIESNDELRAELTPHGFHRGSGKESINLRSGARLKFIARSRGGARGFTGDRIVLDEAYDLPAKAIGAMIPALSARSMRTGSNPQIWYVSSAPHEDSEVLHDVRQRGRTADADARMFYAEWSNDADADPEDRDAWYRANPALGIRISEEWVAETELAVMPAPEFARERLGIADEPLATGGAVIAPVDWQAVTDPTSVVTDPVVFGVDASPDRQWASISVAGHRSGGGQHVEVVDHRAGVPWLVGRLIELRSKWPGSAIVVDPASPAWSIVAELAAAGVEVTKVSAQSLAASCGAFVDAVTARTVHYRPDEFHAGAMHAAVFAARKRSVGDGWAWSRKDSQSDITPLVAATLAFGHLPAAASQEHTVGFVDLDDFLED